MNEWTLSQGYLIYNVGESKYLMYAESDDNLTDAILEALQSVEPQQWNISQDLVDTPVQ